MVARLWRGRIEYPKAPKGSCRTENSERPTKNPSMLPMRRSSGPERYGKRGSRRCLKGSVLANAEEKIGGPRHRPERQFVKSEETRRTRFRTPTKSEPEGVRTQETGSGQALVIG
jgi:hypothetical protein